MGATATGKTALGEALADALGGEVVCCDSRQVFRSLEIGTGKPTPAERAARPHHLFDTLPLDDRPTAGWYGAAARAACAGIRARGRPPVLVGGSGLYLRAAMEGLSPEPPHDAQLRVRLLAALEQEGPEALHRRLAAVDPRSAQRLAPQDRQRIVRALEVVEASGRPIDWWRAQAHGGAVDVPAGAWRVVELTLAPAALARRIEARTHGMLANGLIEETAALVSAGHEARLRALRAIGYDETLELLAGRLDRDAAAARISQRTRQLAKRQRTWFRHQVAAARVPADTAEPAQLLRAALEVVRGTA